MKMVSSAIAAVIVGSAIGWAYLFSDSPLDMQDRIDLPVLNKSVVDRQARKHPLIRSLDRYYISSKLFS